MKGSESDFPTYPLHYPVVDQISPRNNIKQQNKSKNKK